MTLTPPPPPPPVVERPAPYEASYGIVSGVAAPGSVRVVVSAGGHVLRTIRLAQGKRAFRVQVELPARETTVRVATVDRRGRRAARSVGHVLGLPAAAQPRFRAAYVEPRLRGELLRLAKAFPGACAVHVQSLTSGAGASWNSGAAFPAASTLKLAIAVTALARTQGTPLPGSRLDRLLRSMLWNSDNAAANAVEAWFGGSTSGGSALVNALMRSIGLTHTEMYGGYVIGTRLLAGPQPGIPARVDEQPWFGAGKKTTAHDLAGLARAVWLASGGLGALRRTQPGFTPADARYLLYLLARVQHGSKLARVVERAPDVVVAHKAGWIDSARHDAGLVFWRGGVFAVAVMTYRPGAGRSSDVLAGRVAATALARFRG